jgi:hypothetical protein
VANGLEMLSGRGKKEYAKEAQIVVEAGPDSLPVPASNGTSDEPEDARVAL